MTSKRDDGGPAFPKLEWYSLEDGGYEDRGPSGMTLRDWFAGQALQGLIACDGRYGLGNGNIGLDAIDAYRLADAMLRERAD